MLTDAQMHMIQELKLEGYTKSQIAEAFRAQGIKPPSAPAISKYYNMDVLPKNPRSRLEKNKAFDHEPYRSVIIEVLRNNSGNRHLCISSVYDVLMERFDELPANEQTLRNYVHWLEDNDIVNLEPKNERIYDHVFDTAPGDQLLIDFGQLKIGRGKEVHFICLLLRYSRYMLVYAQDHKYNSEEACRALYSAFSRINGRPATLVIDQDADFINREIYGEVFRTRIFGDFCDEQDLKLWVCHKSDPESKGPIENVVGFVKKNYFSARTLDRIDDVWRTLPGWLERKNRRVHQATFQIPLEIFNTIEQAELRPLIPSFYENSPQNFICVELRGTPYIQYKTNRYSVPRDCCFHKVYYKLINNKMHIYDELRRYVCTHTLSESKGQHIQLPEHKKAPSGKWIPIVERLRNQWNCLEFQHFINGVKEENPRYLEAQLSAIERFLDTEQPERAMVATVMQLCCEDFSYQFTQFQAVFNAVKKGRLEEPAYTGSEVQKQDMQLYQKAFDERCQSSQLTGGKPLE